MTGRRARILIWTVPPAAVLLIALGWSVWGWFHTLRHIPEAYAAWDTGTLLVHYLKNHENEWPASWDDLLSVLDPDAPGPHVPLRGPIPPGELKTVVAVDWHFDISHIGNSTPVTRPDGSVFPFIWEDPNVMVFEYLQSLPGG